MGCISHSRNLMVCISHSRNNSQISVLVFRNILLPSVQQATREHSEVRVLKPTRCTSSSSSVGATARFGLWPVQQHLSIFPSVQQATREHSEVRVLKPTRCTSSSSSVGATARCGLWPVQQHLSIFPSLSPTLSIFSLPALKDLFFTSSLHPFLSLPLRLVLSSS